MQKVAYGGWTNCLRLANQEIELIATTDVGPRIIRFGFIGGQNLLAEFSEELGQWGGDSWRPYGGHRLWHAPEANPRTYAPDNGPVAYTWHEGVLTLIQSTEESTGITKEMSISLDPEQNVVRVVHRLTNKTLWSIHLAPWAITQMAPEGTALFPQEPFVPHPTALLPARPMALWAYTKMHDPRWTWGDRYIQLKQDPAQKSPQKFGIRNSLGWEAYVLNGELFIKRYSYEEKANYPDFDCNTESYVDGNVLELESLGSLVDLEPGQTVTHIEEWYLFQAAFSCKDEDEITQVLGPILVRIHDRG
jgi:hypothetical protein